MFRKLHNSFTDVMCNPFYTPGDPIQSKWVCLMFKHVLNRILFEVFVVFFCPGLSMGSFLEWWYKLADHLLLTIHCTDHPRLHVTLIFETLWINVNIVEYDHVYFMSTFIVVLFKSQSKYFIKVHIEKCKYYRQHTTFPSRKNRSSSITTWLPCIHSNKLDPSQLLSHLT